MRDWRHLRFRHDTVLPLLAIEILERGPLRIVAANASDELQVLLRGIEEVTPEFVTTEPVAHHARQHGESILAGGNSPWIEFRREALAGGDPIRAVRDEVNWLTLAAALLLIVITLACWTRTVRNDKQTAQLLAQQESLFREALPGSRIPQGVVSRLRSERTKLRGAHVGGDRLELPVPALDLLHAFLASLPPNETWRFPEIDIDNGNLRIDAELPSHASANTLAGELRERGFQIDAPATTQTADQTVEARLFGHWEPEHSDRREEER